jgi:uncharacterized protein YecE (DUF72 family)
MRLVPRKSSPAASPSSALPPIQLFAGTSGWAYPTWKPGFYPQSVSTRKFLSFYATLLNSVEVNYTFTKLPTPKQTTDWLTQTPESFRFTFKAPQRITHFSRLLDCNQHVADFLASIAPIVASKRAGLILFQLPPNFKAAPQRLADLLTLAALQNSPPLAFEFRNDTWFNPETYAILTAHNAALCIAESEKLETPELHTARTHSCFRLRKPGGYKPGQITALAQRLADLSRERDVYVYFKHEDEPTGALNAAAFLKSAAKFETKAQK